MSSFAALNVYIDTLEGLKNAITKLKEKDSQKDGEAPYDLIFGEMLEVLKEISKVLEVRNKQCSTDEGKRIGITASLMASVITQAALCKSIGKDNDFYSDEAKKLISFLDVQIIKNLMNEKVWEAKPEEN